MQRIVNATVVVAVLLLPSLGYAQATIAGVVRDPSTAVLPGVDFERGMSFANKIHNSGQALVWSGHRELAELYWEQLHGHGLTMAPLER